MEDRE
jgi:hypothetical protein